MAVNAFIESSSDLVIEPGVYRSLETGSEGGSGFIACHQRKAPKLRLFSDFNASRIFRQFLGLVLFYDFRGRLTSLSGGLCPSDFPPLLANLALSHVP